MRCSPLPRTLTIASSRCSDGAGSGQVDDAVHRHQPVELIFDLLDHHRRAAGHDSDTREMLLMLGLGDGERVDIVAAAGEQADDAREHAGLVVDKHAEGADFDALLAGAAG